MKLSTHQISKIDNALKEALEQAEGHEFLRTVMVLGSPRKEQSGSKLKPSDFPSRTAYREALISDTQQHQSTYLGNVKKGLADLALDVKGGAISQSVVVEGTAGNILSSLELPEVRHASLDQPIHYNLDSGFVDHE